MNVQMELPDTMTVEALGRFAAQSNCKIRYRRGKKRGPKNDGIEQAKKRSANSVAKEVWGLEC